MTKFFKRPNINSMPTKTKKSKTQKSQSTSKNQVHFFAGTRLKLEFIIIAFLAVSALLMLHITNQKDELDVYKEAVAGMSLKK